VACGDEVADDRVAPVQPVGIGEDEAEFLGGSAGRFRHLTMASVRE
jgi:hypothetical protein